MESIETNSKSVNRIVEVSEEEALQRVMFARGHPWFGGGTGGDGGRPR